MVREFFEPWPMRPVTFALIDQLNAIIDEYQPQGLRLTVRQLFYQMVARGLIENTEAEYRKIGRLVTNGRDSGRIDWDAIEDRTRDVHRSRTWSEAADRLHSAADTYGEDLWADQDYRVEVWIEKEALLGVIEGVCNELRVDHCAHRGNASASLAYEAGKRFADIIALGQLPLVLHLADHDPTGVHMTHDLAKRFSKYAGTSIEVRRIGLTLAQVRRYAPPPNTAKESDTRTPQYVEEFGFDDCWELDALPPDVLITLIRDNVEAPINRAAGRPRCAANS